VNWLQKKIPAWVIALTIVIALGAIVVVAASVRYVLMGGERLGMVGKIVTVVAEFPSLVQRSLKEVAGMATPAPEPQLLEDRFPSESGLSVAGNYHDSGFLLLSGLDSGRNEHVVELIRLSDGNTLHEWYLDYDTFFKKTPVDGGSYTLFSKDRLRMQHPYLDDHGSIVFNTQQGPMVKIDACSRHLWTNNMHFHHSIETDSDGNYWVPAVIHPPVEGKTILAGKYRDDALAKLNADGEILELISLARILEESGYRGLLFGVRTFGKGLLDPDKDLLHLNNIFPAKEDSKYWKKGDLLLSIRNLSSVALYRPASNRILWLRTGPWLNQHDARFTGKSKISVFGNDNVRDQGIYNQGGVSKIYIIDLEDGSITSPYSKLLAELEFRSPTEGRSRVLEDGTVYIEESNYGRLIKISANELLWSYINRYSSEKVGKVSWSRYLTAEETQTAIQNLRSISCQE
jgi:hypothetical protein